MGKYKCSINTFEQARLGARVCLCVFHLLLTEALGDTGVFVKLSVHALPVLVTITYGARINVIKENCNNNLATK